MSPELYELLRVVAMGATFLMVLAVWIAGVFIWIRRTAAKREQMSRRLGIGSTTNTEKTLRLWTHGREVTTNVAVSYHPRSLVGRLEGTAFKAGWNASGWQILVLLVGGYALIFCFAALLTHNVFIGIGVVVTAFIILRIVVFGRISAREKLFETQFMDAMELAARSLRAGHPLLGAFQLISEEMPSPVRDVFGGICQQHGMGGELEDILRNAGRRTESEDMRLFATSVALQMRSGGNLADLMDRVARVIRERMRITRRIRVLTAQTQMSKRILLGLPVMIFVLFNIINPKYMHTFYATFTGQVLLGVSLVMLGLGAWIMNRMVAIKV